MEKLDEKIKSPIWKESTIYGIIGTSTKEIKKELLSISPELEVYVIKKYLESTKDYPTVYSRMENEIRRRNLVIKNLEKKIIDSLKIVGLRVGLLNQNIQILSTSERKMIQLAICLITNPDIIILEEPFQDLDKKMTKKLLNLLQKMKEQYHKIIIFTSEDNNILYQYTNRLIIYKNNELLKEGTPEELFQDIPFLKKHRIKIPDMIEMTYLAKKEKNIKLEYHKDIRDIIKDIYKHV